MNSTVVGIDVGEDKSEACYLSPAGDTLDQFNFQILFIVRLHFECLCLLYG